MNSTPSLNNRLGERIPRAYAMSGHPIREASSPDAIAPLIHQSNQRRPTILVVDDRAINREFLVSLLTCAGYQTVEASSPTELPQVAQLDLIITDVHMPGMNGLDFLRALRVDSITSQVPVILYTAAYKTPAIEATAKNMGAFAVLTKPTAPEIILEQVRAALGSKAGGTTPLGFSIEGTSSEFRPARRSPVQLGYRSATLIEIMLDLAGERDPDHLLRLFCYGAKELIGVQAASAHLVASAESRGHLMFSTSAGPHSSGPQFLSDCDCGLIALTKEAKGRCLRGRGETKAGLAVSPQAGASTMLYVPIATSANHLGCLCLVDKGGGQDFGDEDERLITTLATKLAIVYENIRLYKELERFAARVARESEARERTQEELDFSRQEQARLKDEFLSHVSHELRSPVMVIQQSLEILQEGGAAADQAQQHEYLDIALRNTSQLNSMISDLLEVTRIETGKLRVDPRSMALTDVLNEAVASARLTAKQKRITLSLDMPDVLPMAIADRSRVRQILTNLLDNAIKFTPENGAVTIRAGLDGRDARFVRVEVADTGCGMSPEEAPRVFDRLYQVPNADCAARKGLGLGLCICKQLVELQGGQIEVESQVRAGSTFTFTLPIFSMSNVLAPILGADAVPESIVLLTVEVSDPGGVNRKPVLASLRETIERCVLPGLDAVMPDTYDTRDGQMFIVLARTDERGAQVLARRLEDQLKLNPQTGSLSTPPRIQLSTVDLSAARTDSLPGPVAQREAAVEEIEQNLKQIIAGMR